MIDSNGAVIQRYHYTPFGVQEPVKAGEPDKDLTLYGYTGQEEIKSFNLIHMGGRLYDPLIGRFLSPDPTVQYPENPQDLNRYSYCMNNPINRLDPNGYGFFDFLSSVFDSVGNLIDGLFEHGGFQQAMGLAFGAAALAVGNFWVSAAIMTSFSGANTAMNGGSVEDALTNMAITFGSACVWGETGSILKHSGYGTRVVVHGLVGGGLEAAQGGDFMNGFMTTAVAEAIPINSIGGKDADITPAIAIQRTAAIVGGTVSAMTGGNFGDGARSAAFAELYNSLADAKKQQRQEKSQAEFVERPLDVATIHINGSEYHIPGPDINATDHWAIKLPNGKIEGYYSDNTVHASDSLHASWYHETKFGNATMTFDMDKMSHALEITSNDWNGSRYKAISHNCHGFVGAVINEYEKEGGQIHWHHPSWGM